MSDLELLQKNLNYQIKAQEIGLASWKGSRGPPQKMTIPTKDYLLNSASRQQDLIKNRNNMVEEYLEEQQTPIFRYDEFGDVILDDDGKPKEYKFHGSTPPELDLAPLRINIFDPIRRMMVDRDIPIADQKQILQNKNAYIIEKSRTIDENIRQYKEDLENNKQVIIEYDTTIQDLKKQNDDMYAIPDLKDRRKLVKRNKEAISSLLRGKQRLAQEIEDIKTIINTSITEKQQYEEDIENIAAQVQDKLKENEQKIKTYNEELNALNSGQLNTSKAFDETDEEYAQRLQRMADVPFADRRSQEKAINREKEKLRENMKLIIRNNAVINQVVNALYSNEPLLIFEINKFFNGFKEYFIKKFGSDNEKIDFREILSEISFYLKRSTDPRVLAGNVTNPEEIAQAVARNLPQSIIPYQERRTSAPVSSSLNSPFSDEFGTGPEDILNEFQKFVDATDASLKGLIQPPDEGQLTGEESEGEVENKLRIELVPTLGVNETMVITNSTGKKLYIKFYVENVKIKKKEGKLLQDKEFVAPIFFVSMTGEPKSFHDISYRNLIDRIALFFGVTKSEVYKLMGKRASNKSFTKEDMSDFLSTNGLLPTISKPPKILKTEPLVIGYGIKNSQDIPDKVNFGSNILFLKKLFLKNILSIQNKHNTKINGFNNVNVSDNFVKIIMNLLKNIDFTNNDLQSLSNGERVLLDNLLTLSELNKKFITGSNISSLNQLKKEYELLIGEIEAGNNNEILKKKLYTLLMKLVHFGCISQAQERKQYKDIIKEYF